LAALEMLASDSAVTKTAADKALATSGA